MKLQSHLKLQSDQKLMMIESFRGHFDSFWSLPYSFQSPIGSCKSLLCLIFKPCQLTSKKFEVFSEPFASFRRLDSSFRSLVALCYSLFAWFRRLLDSFFCLAYSFRSPVSCFQSLLLLSELSQHISEPCRQISMPWRFPFPNSCSCTSLRPGIKSAL